MSWEQRLVDLGVPIWEDAAITEGGLQMGKLAGGCVLARPDGDGYILNVAIIPGMPPEGREVVCEFAFTRLERLLEYGPDLDGWQLRSDGDLQMWVVAEQLDPWLTEHA